MTNTLPLHRGAGAHKNRDDIQEDKDRLQNCRRRARIFARDGLKLDAEKTLVGGQPCEAEYELERTEHVSVAMRME